MKTAKLQLKGLDHINFACTDMERTIAFWESIGVPVALKLVLHNPERFHFFFDMGNSSYFSYWFWPGRDVAPATDDSVQDHAGFYHIAFHVDTEDELDEMHALLTSKNMQPSEIAGRHLFDKSFYFKDPDGIAFEFACPVFRLSGTVDHDGNGTLTPMSPDAMLQNRRLDGPVRFETRYK